MKTVTYSVSEFDRAQLEDIFNTELEKAISDFNSNPGRYGSKTVGDLLPTWIGNAASLAMFNILRNDGLAAVEVHKDQYATFSDVVGYMFDPEVNDNLDPKDLKREERNYRALVNRRGIWWVQLVADGNELDSIGGFVGDDFWGSGYDVDFANEALDFLVADHSEYIEHLRSAMDRIEKRWRLYNDTK